MIEGIRGVYHEGVSPQTTRDGSVPGAVVASGVTKVYRDLWRRSVTALSGFDLSVAPGEVVGLVGRNGSGKTTALRCLLGLCRLTAGSVRLLGRAPGEREVRMRLGYVPERSDLNPLLTPSLRNATERQGGLRT